MKNLLNLELKNDFFLDDTSVLTQIGYGLETGSVFQKNLDMAFIAYERAADGADPQGINNLGWMYLNGYGCDRDVEKAIELFEEAAELKNTTAMVNLGNIYEDDIYDFVLQDYDKAFHWYSKAADLGDPKGWFNVANMYHYGRGVEQNYEKAFEIFSALYEEGDKSTCFYMGLYHQMGFAVEQNYKKAFYYYKIGHTEGDKYCTHQLGVMYGKGLGVKKNPGNAEFYYKQSAEAGDALSYLCLAELYEYGDLGKVDMKKASECYQIAFEMDPALTMDIMTKDLDE